MAILSSPLDYVSSTPVVTRALAVSTLLSSSLYIFLRWNGAAPFSLPYLTLVPGTSIFYPWTLLTSGFVETNIIQVSLDTVNHTTHFLTPFAAFLHTVICTSLIPLSRTAMGSCRNG